MEQMFSEARNYERARRFITKEVNAVIEAAFEHGADEVVVSDSHNNNIFKEYIEVFKVFRVMLGLTNGIK